MSLARIKVEATILVASDCGFQPQVLPNGGWEAAVTGTLEACLYTARCVLPVFDCEGRGGRKQKRGPELPEPLALKIGTCDQLNGRVHRHRRHRRRDHRHRRRHRRRRGISRDRRHHHRHRRRRRRSSRGRAILTVRARPSNSPCRSALRWLSALLRVAHGHESEPARAAGHAVHHQVGFNDRAVRGKRVLQVVFGGVEGKISDKQFCTHVMFYCPRLTPLSRLFPTIGFQIITEPSSPEDLPCRGSDKLSILDNRTMTVSRKIARVFTKKRLG